MKINQVRYLNMKAVAQEEILGFILKSNDQMILFIKWITVIIDKDNMMIFKHKFK